ncbi:MAG: tetratricopeptide repeat protein [Acidobacteriota bacterium]|nr:tetratricopeptide repeat protein [Acidobacteriota bacterium]
MIKPHHSLLIAVAVLAGSGLFAPAQQMPDKAQGHPSRPIMQDEPQTAASALSASEAHLRSELAAHPDSADLLYRLALVLQQENKPQESLQTFTKAAQLQKPTAGQLRSVALDYVLLNDYDDAIHWLRVALGIDPRNVAVLYSLGRCFYTQNLFPQAEAAFTRVLQLEPRHLKAEENLGLTYDYENQPAKAELALRTAAAWNAEQPSTDPWPDLDLGVFLLGQNRIADALPFLTRAASIAPNLALAHQTLGRALVSTGRAADGVKELQIAAQLDPANPKVHFELGHAYREAGELDKARAEFAVSKSLYGSHNQN